MLNYTLLQKATALLACHEMTGWGMSHKEMCINLGKELGIWEEQAEELVCLYYKLFPSRAKIVFETKYFFLDVLHGLKLLIK